MGSNPTLGIFLQSVGVVMFRSVGRFSSSSGRLVVLVDTELARYYRSQIPKSMVCRAGRYAPHITVVRNEPYEKDLQDPVEFEYDPYIHFNGVYWWLNCFSPTLISVRLELGLPASTDLTRPPDGSECFHMTVGNTK